MKGPTAGALMAGSRNGVGRMLSASRGRSKITLWLLIAFSLLLAAVIVTEAANDLTQPQLELQPGAATH